jgi:TDG/mug DNA glycosylase family protein
VSSEHHLVKAASDEVGLRRESRIEAGDVPLWLARLHRSLPVGSEVRISISGSLPISEDDLIEGAGFSADGPLSTRLETIPDTVAPQMKMLVCGLNPGKISSDLGVSFAKKGNRFWPAALAAGIVTTDRAPDHALLHSGVGFTDLAKRTTTRADEINGAEFRSGASRIERLVRWLQPDVFLMVGLTGWRQSVDRKAASGWQPTAFGGRPVYLMPNTSGLNTHETLESLTAHLEKAQAGPI